MDVQIDMIKKNGLMIQHVECPSEELQLIAVQQNKYAIRYIHSPSKKFNLQQ